MSSNPIKDRKPYRLSSTTKAYAFRLPNGISAILERKARKQGVLPSEWLKRRMIYDISRKHVSQKNNVKEEAK